MDNYQFKLALRQEVNQYACNGRIESAAFLVWYLKNFFRIEEPDAIDSVCDGHGDKGIDGIFVDDADEEIYLFQTKFSPNDDRVQGENDLKHFVGSAKWFEDGTAVENLIESTANRELKSLVERLNLLEKVRSGYSVNLQFITNKLFDANANEFLTLSDNILEGFDAKRLFEKYTYIVDDEIITSETCLNLASNNTKIEYNLDGDVSVRVYSISANELLKLNGIQDRTLFYKNVRYGLGRTRVNTEIKKTIKNDSEHNKFFLYHNGITIVCDTLEEDTDSLTIQNYTVINGCQSMLSFFENRDKITEDIFVLTKVIKLETNSPLIQKITYFANNQNPIKLKDLKSNDRVQIALQNEFEELFNGNIDYRIKPGASNGGQEIITIDFAAQLITAFYLKTPQNTHLNAKMFGELYSKVFSFKITAAKIYLAKIVYDTIKENTVQLDNEQIRNYNLALFFFTYSIGEILRQDETGLQILEDPTEYVTTHLDILKDSLFELWGRITPDINVEIEDYISDNDDFFDYKNVFKNKKFIDRLFGKIKANYVRMVRRNGNDSFSEIFKLLSQ